MSTQWMRRYFDSIDTNSNGYITKQEIKNSLVQDPNNDGILTEGEKKTVENQVQAWIKQAGEDTWQDEQITFPELCEMLLSEFESPPPVAPDETTPPM